MVKPLTTKTKKEKVNSFIEERDMKNIIVKL